MTDMRATEQILERIGKQAQALFALGEDGGARADTALSIVHDVAELRRRGDTLVRSRDLELLVQAVSREQILLGEDEAQALARLDGALGGA